MSHPHSLRCVFATCTPRSSPFTSSRLHNLRKRPLHSSPCHHSRPSPKFPNVKASELGLTSSQASSVPSKPIPSTDSFPAYTARDLAALKKKYTPDQLAAISAGEAAISPDDLLNQAALRSDPMMIKYLDDFAERRDVLDTPVPAPEENYDPNLRFKTEDEIVDDLTNWAMNLPDEPGLADYVALEEMRVTVGKPEAELNPRSYEAPEIPKLTDPMTRSAVKAAGMGAQDEAGSDPNIQRLLKRTGMTLQQIRRLRQKNLVMHRVVNQTRMGKVQSTYYLNIAGDGRGMVGIGEGKSTEPEDARKQAEINAIRNMVPIHQYEGRTIYGDVKGKVGATELVLMNRPPGM